MKINKQNQDLQNRRYEALTPVADIANGQEYMAALDWAIQQQDVHNVAISGPYGSGKSSVIRSYLRSHNDIKALQISLAAFNLDSMKVQQGEEEKKLDENKTEEKKREEKKIDKCNKNKFDEKQLEIGILKQLFYSVDADRIPQSRYRKLQSEKKYKNVLIGLLFEVLLCAVLYCAFPDWAETLSNRINDIYGIFWMLIYGGFWVATGIACILLVGWFRKNGSIQEVKVLDKATLKNEKGGDESVFNRNMDEIVYFFEATGYQLVIIEDLDRFESTNIFVALRELNNLLNHYEKIKSKITFVYAIKDDMFEEEGERTKFFDFIIPIVPYISSTNSGEILRQKLLFNDSENKSSIYDISGRFITLISPFISDMRDLTCICNEFNIFKNTLKGNQNLNLIDENMFSLIVFKNLYPKDFAELENETESSIVRKAFANKRNLIKKKEELINEKRQTEAKVIKEIEGETLNSVRELKLALFGCLMNFQASIRQINVGGKTYYTESMLKDDFDINELRGKNLIIYYNIENRSSSTSVDDIDQVVKENGGNYFERIERIQKGLAKSKEESRKRIKEYEKEMNELHAQSIERMIEKFDTEFLDERVRKNDLLVFLLRHGYIDEQYENYINYFHPNSITKEEMNFVLGVRNHRFEMDYTYPLKNAARIFDRLQDFEFKQKEVLNYDLVDFVLENKGESDSAHRLIEQLSNHSIESMSFIKAYIERGKNIDILIPRLCKENVFFWSDITDDDGIPIETRFKYLELIFKYADIAEIVEQDCTYDDEEEEGMGILSNFLISYPMILENIQGVSAEKLIKILAELRVQFINVELREVDETVKKDIFENRRYVLNKEMIQKLVEWKAPELVSDLSTKHYTTVMRLNYEPLLDYIQEKICNYVSEMVVIPESNVNEELDAVEDILERLLVQDTGLCIAVLDKEHVVWDDITRCCGGVETDENIHVKVIWDYLLSNNRVSCTWNNFIAYYGKFGSGNVWSKYFDDNVDVLLADHDNSAITENIMSVILSLDVTEESFRKLILRMEFDPYEGELESLDKTKLKIMVEEAKLPYSVKYWNDLADIAPELRFSYAERNKNDFIASIEDIQLIEKEVNAMLISAAFASEDKRLILSKIDVSELSIETAEVIRGLDFTVDREYVDAAWNLLPVNDRYELLLNQLDVYKNSELPELFSKLAPVYRQLVKRTRHKYTFVDTIYNRALLNKLLKRGYLTSVEEEWVEEKNHVLFTTEKERRITGFVKQSKV